MFFCFPIFNIDNPFFFYYIFFSLFLFNYFVFSNIKSSNFKLDLLIQWARLFLSNFKNLFLIIIINLKKFLIFFIFQSNEFFKSKLVFFKIYWSNFFLIWRPIFKKFSYFGFFRTHRNKWIK